MRNKIITHYHLKRSNSGTTNEALIYLRLTVNGERTEISADKKINPATWNKANERVKGRGEGTKVHLSFNNSRTTEKNSAIPSI
jgi:hypothetical protein